MLDGQARLQLQILEHLLAAVPLVPVNLNRADRAVRAFLGNIDEQISVSFSSPRHDFEARPGEEIAKFRKNNRQLAVLLGLPLHLKPD